MQPAYCRTLGRVIRPFERQIYGAVQIGHDYSKPQVKTPTIMSDFDFLIMPDRGDESDSTVDGAQTSFVCLNDDVIQLVVAFLPACRDVLSLSVTRSLAGAPPERGDAAADWPYEHLEYREDEVGNPWARALKPPPLFMIGNCLLVWSNRNRGRRAQFTVWRF